MNSFSPQSTGELWPIPGNSIFQFRSLAVQVAGMVLASLSPVPLGPRKRVHSWAADGNAVSAAQQATANDASRNWRMGRTFTGGIERRDDLRADSNLRR